MTETLIDKLEAEKVDYESTMMDSDRAYNQAIDDCIAVVRQHEAAQPQDVQDLLRDMRRQVEYSDKATMPIPLYERMKVVITAMGGARSSDQTTVASNQTLSGYAREQETVFDWCAGHGFTPVTSEINDLLNLLRGGEK